MYISCTYTQQRTQIPQACCRYSTFLPTRYAEQGIILLMNNSTALQQKTSTNHVGTYSRYIWKSKSLEVGNKQRLQLLPGGSSVVLYEAHYVEAIPDKFSNRAQDAVTLITLGSFSLLWVPSSSQTWAKCLWSWQAALDLEWIPAIP